MGRHTSTRRLRVSGAVLLAVIGLGSIGWGSSKLLEPSAEYGAMELVIPTPTATITATTTATATRVVKTTKTVQVTKYVRAASRDETRYGIPQAIARELLAARGWASQWSCLNSLIMRESGWNVHATNPKSGAYGIPQSLPASKMASAGSDWRTNPRTQLVWMMGYIKSVYSTPCGAWAHSQKTGWY
jgi:hypothetical protein